MVRMTQMRPETQFFPTSILARLHAVKAYALTLVEAPSGFGKTTVLNHFFEQKVSDTAQVRWHTFSQEQPGTAWKAFCGLIRTFDAKSADRLLEAGMPDEDTLPEVQDIFRQLQCAEETYLVLDDFTAWNLAVPGDFLMALAEHGGKELHIVVASQLLPEEAQTVLLQNSRFLVLREAVLAFSQADIDAYYRQAGVFLTDAQLEEVSKMTEGWIMALYLQLLSYMESGQFERGGMQNLIHKALWNRLPAQEQHFLMAVSIFPRFTLAQATALSGMSAVDTERLLRGKRVFVHFDREARRFYLHNLFQSFLAEQFALLSEGQQQAIYLAGGQLAEQAGDRVNTLRFYYLSGAWEHFFSLSLTSYEIADVVDETTKPMILDIMRNTPFSIKRKYPAAMVPLAFTLFFLHENQMLRSFQAEIDEAIRQSTLPQAKKDALLGEMELLLSFLEYNRIDAMSARHRRALALLDGPANLISVKSTWTFGAPSVLYMFYRESGKLDEELLQMDACMPVYYQLTDGHGSGAEIMMRAEAYFMRGEAEDAEILCHRAMFTADSKRQNSIYQCGLFLLARIAVLRGDTGMLQSAIGSLEERAHQNTEDLCRYTLDLARGYLYLLLDRGEELPSWLSEGEIADKRLVIMTQPFAHILYGRLLLARGEYQKLLGVSAFALGLSGIFPNLLPQIYLKLYMAQALQILEKREQACAALQEALEIALPDRIYFPFAENYAGIQTLLAETACGEEALAQIHALSDTLSQGLAAFQRKKWTPRESEILALLKQDMTNKQIAGRLYLSPNTIRNVISGMLEKCGFASREQLKQLPEEK